MARYMMAKKMSAKSFASGKVRPPFVLNADGSIQKHKGGENDGEDMIANGETKWLFDVYGMANDVRKGESNLGPWCSLIGDFMGVGCDLDKKTGKKRVIRAGELFLPDIALNLILGQGVGDGQFVEFGFRIGVIGDDTAVTKYVYTCEPLMEAEQSSPVEQLVMRVAPDALPALEAPKPAQAEGATQSTASEAAKPDPRHEREGQHGKGGKAKAA